MGEDDIFEEFPTKEAVEKTDEGDVNIWEDNWDDDAVEDDFSVQLSTFCRKRSHPDSSRHSPPLRSPEPHPLHHLLPVKTEMEIEVTHIDELVRMVFEMVIPVMETEQVTHRPRLS